MKKFDKEYSTQWIDEMEWLKKNGIEYTYVKTINGVTTYKYTKTHVLFIALAYYYMINME